MYTVNLKGTYIATTSENQTNYVAQLIADYKLKCV